MVQYLKNRLRHIHYELLQMIFAAELLKASDRPIWIVSPWLSNVEVFERTLFRTGRIR